MLIQTNEGALIDPSKAAILSFDCPLGQGAARVMYTDNTRHFVDASQLQQAMEQMAPTVKWEWVPPLSYLNSSLFSKLRLARDENDTLIVKCFVGEELAWTIRGSMVPTIMWPSWERLAGEHLQTMLTSPEEVVKGLSSPSPQIRNVSWQMLLKGRGNHPDVDVQSMEAIRHDSDLDVRVRAVYYLAARGRKSADPRVSAFFAELALAPDTPARMREAAYFGLLRVHGRPIPRDLSRNVRQAAPEQPYPIDWEFVRQFDPAR
jgi:hypothetical protein